MAGILSDHVPVVAGVNGVVVGKLEHFLEWVIDENKADESRKAFLCEACEVLHKEAGIRRHQHQTQEAWPQTNPQSEFQVV